MRLLAACSCSSCVQASAIRSSWSCWTTRVASPAAARRNGSALSCSIQVWALPTGTGPSSVVPGSPSSEVTSAGHWPYSGGPTTGSSGVAPATWSTTSLSRVCSSCAWGSGSAASGASPAVATGAIRVMAVGTWCTLANASASGPCGCISEAFASMATVRTPSVANVPGVHATELLGQGLEVPAGTGPEPPRVVDRQLQSCRRRPEARPGAARDGLTETRQPSDLVGRHERGE